MENREILDQGEAGEIPALKKFILPALAAFGVLCVYFIACWMIDISYASREEDEYSKALLSKAQAANDIMAARGKYLANSLDVFRRVYLTEFAGDKRGIGSVIDLFEEELDSFPELVGISYMNAASELVYARGIEGDEGEAAVNASIDWAREYWTRLGPDDEKPFYTPVRMTGGNYLQGMLFPVAVDEKIAGGLVAAVDAGTAASKGFELADIREGTAVFLVDDKGAVICSSGKGDKEKLPDASFMTKDFMTKVLSSQNGSQVYRYIQEVRPGKKGYRKLILAWQQTRLGSKDAVIVAAAHAEKAAAVFRKARLAHMLLELFFAVCVAAAVAPVLLKRCKRMQAPGKPD